MFNRKPNGLRAAGRGWLRTARWSAHAVGVAVKRSCPTGRALHTPAGSSYALGIDIAEHRFGARTPLACLTASPTGCARQDAAGCEPLDGAHAVGVAVKRSCPTGRALTRRLAVRTRLGIDIAEHRFGAVRTPLACLTASPTGCARQDAAGCEPLDGARTPLAWRLNGLAQRAVRLTRRLAVRTHSASTLLSTVSARTPLACLTASPTGCARAGRGWLRTARWSCARRWRGG